MKLPPFDDSTVNPIGQRPGATPSRPEITRARLETTLREICKRCGRGHSGVCGIPPAVSKHTGLRSIPGQGFSPHRKPIAKKPTTTTLQRLLAQARNQLEKVIVILGKLPKELPEYDQLLDQEGKLQNLIKQLVQQIGARK